jgi:hypothetical protein
MRQPLPNRRTSGADGAGGFDEGGGTGTLGSVLDSGRPFNVIVGAITPTTVYTNNGLVGRVCSNRRMAASTGFY